MGMLWLIGRGVRASAGIGAVAFIVALLVSLPHLANMTQAVVIVVVVTAVTALLTALIEGVLLWTHKQYDAFVLETLRHHPRSRWLQYTLVSQDRAIRYARLAGTEPELETLTIRATRN